MVHKQNTYALIDSGDGKKLERFGSYVFARPCSQAVWKPQISSTQWSQADAVFSREDENKWTKQKSLLPQWNIQVADIIFKIAPTDFGHLGIFPEQKTFWDWIQKKISTHKTASFTPRVLNLFAYSGGSTLAAARAGAAVCHVDASKGMVSWARENAHLNQLEKAPIRWIVEDVNKFLIREERRGSFYDAIILDPPSFGRGSKGELFKIEVDIVDLLNRCRCLLTEKPLFVLFSCHTPGFSPLVMEHLLMQTMQGVTGKIETGEMILEGSQEVLSVPSGTYAKWEKI